MPRARYRCNKSLGLTDGRWVERPDRWIPKVKKLRPSCRRVKDEVIIGELREEIMANLDGYRHWKSLDDYGRQLNKCPEPLEYMVESVADRFRVKIGQAKRCVQKLRQEGLLVKSDRAPHDSTRDLYGHDSAWQASVYIVRMYEYVIPIHDKRPRRRRK